MTDNSLHTATSRRLQSALLFGTGSGVLGVCLGGAVGILRSAYPGLAAVYTGVQFFVLGSSASFTRDAILATTPSARTRTNELIASTSAGVVSGAAAGRFWGRLAFIPGGVLFGTLGYFGQRYMHKSQDMPHQDRDGRSLMQRIAESNWSPLQSLSNEEYHKVLSERLVKLDTEIELVEAKLQDLNKLKRSTIEHNNT